MSASAMLFPEQDVMTATVNLVLLRHTSCASNEIANALMSKPQWLPLSNVVKAGSRLSQNRSTHYYRQHPYSHMLCYILRVYVMYTVGGVQVPTPSETFISFNMGGMRDLELRKNDFPIILPQRRGHGPYSKSSKNEGHQARFWGTGLKKISNP